MAASKSAHSHLSRSPQYGHTQTHFSIEFPHSTQIANSSSSSTLEDIKEITRKSYKWFEPNIKTDEKESVSYKNFT